MGLVEKLDRAIQRHQQHDIQCDRKQNQLKELEKYLPQQPSDADITKIIDSVIKLAESEQKATWLFFAKWVDPGSSNFEWRCQLYERLSDEWDRQKRMPQPETKRDIQLALKLFGPGCRLIQHPNVNGGI